MEHELVEDLFWELQVLAVKIDELKSRMKNRPADNLEVEMKGLELQRSLLLEKFKHLR
jgi:hypothetical protein